MSRQTVRRRVRGCPRVRPDAPPPRCTGARLIAVAAMVNPGCGRPRRSRNVLARVNASGNRNEFTAADAARSACAPSTSPTATARLCRTTGLPVRRNNSPYHVTICTQPVAVAVCVSAFKAVPAWACHSPSRSRANADRRIATRRRSRRCPTSIGPARSAPPGDQRGRRAMPGRVPPKRLGQATTVGVSFRNGRTLSGRRWCRDRRHLAGPCRQHHRGWPISSANSTMRPSGPQT